MNSYNKNATNKDYTPITYPADLPNTYLLNSNNYNLYAQEATRQVSMQDSTSYPTIPVTAQMQNELNLDENYFRSIYSHEMKDILLEIDKELNKLDYENSFIFDEYPDKTTMLCIADDIYNHVKELYNIVEPKKVDSGKVENMQFCRNCYPSYYAPNWTRDLILMMLYNEILNRRRNYYYGLPW